MRLDEKGHLEAAQAICLMTCAFSICKKACKCTHEPEDVARSMLGQYATTAITAYLSSIVPGDVQTCIDWLNISADFIGRGNRPTEPKAIETFVSGLRESATALLSLSADNAELKARLHGTVGVEILEK